MATSGAVQDRHVCGVCLESYRGRNPKLLTCHHTFCLSCLRDLEQRATLTRCGPQRADDDDDNGGEQKMTLTFLCPTCQRDIVVPPGGVSQFQTNFYLDHEEGPQAGSLLCGFCGEGQEARYVCTECKNNLCLRCQRCHEKLMPGHTHCVQPLTSKRQLTSQDDHDLPYEEQVTEHIMLLEAALARMGEEEREVRRQRLAADDDIRGRVDGVRALLKQVEEQSRRSLADMAETRGRRIREEMGVARRKHTHLSQLLLQRDSPSAAPVTPASVQQGLLGDSELQFYQQRSRGDRPSVQLVHTFRDEALDLSSLLSYVGSVYDKYEPGAADPSESQVREIRCEPVHGSYLAQSPPDARQLLQRLTSLEEENERLRGLVEALRHDYNKMADDSCRLQEDVSGIRRNLGDLGGDNSRVQQEVNDLHSSLAAVQGSVATLLESNSELQQRFGNLNKSVTGLKEKSSKLVAFHANLASLSSVSTRGALVFNDVKSNVGNAYNIKAGVFKAPISGLYLFIATVLRPSTSGNAEVYIVVDGTQVTRSVPYESETGEGASCTCHVVQKLRAGQKVWMRAWSVGDIRLLGGVSFSGLLIQPEMETP